MDGRNCMAVRSAAKREQSLSLAGRISELDAFRIDVETTESPR